MRAGLGVTGSTLVRRRRPGTGKSPLVGTFGMRERVRVASGADDSGKVEGNPDIVGKCGRRKGQSMVGGCIYLHRVQYNLIRDEKLVPQPKSETSYSR